uniref:Uncharacterized protein n=1 Tax=Anguilla anguilla TaxID=7936 RepID=A0A0E9PWG3_ANGAN
MLCFKNKMCRVELPQTPSVRDSVRNPCCS